MKTKTTTEMVNTRRTQQTRGSSTTEGVTSHDVREKLSEVTSSFPIGNVIPAMELRMELPQSGENDDTRRSSKPLPLIFLASSEVDIPDFRPLDETFLEVLEDCGPQYHSSDSAAAASAVRVETLENGRFVLDMKPDDTSMTAVNFLGGQRHDYGYNEAFVKESMGEIAHQVGNMCQSRGGYKSDRMLVGVVLTVTTGTVEIMNLETTGRDEQALLQVSGNLWNFDSVRDYTGRRSQQGVIGCDMVCFVLERTDTGKKWQILESHRVNRFNNDILSQLCNSTFEVSEQGARAHQGHRGPKQWLKKAFQSRSANSSSLSTSEETSSSAATARVATDAVDPQVGGSAALPTSRYCSV